MNRRNALLIVLGSVVFLITLFITILVTARADLLSPQQSTSSCNTLTYASPNGINILFIASQKEAREYTDYFLAEEPYKRHKDMFNFFYVDTLDVSSLCTSYKGIASLCYSETLLKQAAVCPHDVIVVVVDEPEEIRSSAFKNVISLNKNHPAKEVVRHEFGHIYGLAEEYTPASLPRNQKNCQASCDDFEDSSINCFQGCSKESFYRSIENGVMRTLESSHYGTYDESLIEKKLQELFTRDHKTITGNTIGQNSPCSDQFFYLAEIDTSQEKWAVVSSEKVTGCSSGEVASTYHAEGRDDTNNRVTSISFADDSLFTDAPGSGETIDGETYEQPRSWVELPGETNVVSLDLYDEGGKMRGSAPLSTGGNNLCRVE